MQRWDRGLHGLYREGTDYTKIQLQSVRTIQIQLQSIRIIQYSRESAHGLYRYSLRVYREILRHGEMQRCRYTAYRDTQRYRVDIIQTQTHAVGSTDPHGVHTNPHILIHSTLNTQYTGTKYPYQANSTDSPFLPSPTDWLTICAHLHPQFCAQHYHSSIARQNNKHQAPSPTSSNPVESIHIQSSDRQTDSHPPPHTPISRDYLTHANRQT